VTDDLLKLTTYFGERQRHQGHFLSDELLDLYAHHSVTTSVVLRGIAGFGPRHQLRTDRSLSASEDLPVAVTAFDSADKITALADRVVELTTRGLVTLERAGSADAGATGTVKLTVHVGRSERTSGQPTVRALCDLFHRHGFDCAAAFLGVDGTVGGDRRRAAFFGRNVDVPALVIAVGPSERVAEVLPEIERMTGNPRPILERAQVCKRDGQLLARPTAAPAADGSGRPLWQKLTVHTSESDLHDGTPIHRAIVDRLRHLRGGRGATVLGGVWGFHGDRKPHGDKLFGLGRQVPVATIVVDGPERIAASFDVIDELTTRHGVVTTELVPALVSIDGGERRGGTALGSFDM
jgi:PII-like signaling protein